MLRRVLIVCADLSVVARFLFAELMSCRWLVVHDMIKGTAGVGCLQAEGTVCSV